MKRGKRLAVLLLTLLLTAALSGCKENSSDTRLVLYTGFKEGEVFRIETISCMLPEVMVYLTNTQQQYESVFGSRIWDADLSGITLEENIKETVLAHLAQIKTMNLLAQKHGVELDAAELEKVKEAAAVYYESLNETERAALGVDEGTIEELYAEFALADKVYHYIIKDINPEISDDEARTITVKYVLIKTYAMDGTGKKIEYSKASKEEAKKLAEDILAKAEAGEDFDDLVLTYSEGEKGSYSFGKGEETPEFEEAAFNLETGEISGIVETEYGYNIIQCVNTFNREETDTNKIKIVEKRKEEVFGQEYDAFVESLTRTLNEELWESVTFLKEEGITTSSFFEVYSEYFS